ncbi:MAG: DUF3616 domain-containing protein [Pseudomonadota bacterium]
MKPISVIELEFDSERNALGKAKKLSQGLSVAKQIGHTLWVANDESTTLERLTLVEGRRKGSYRYGRHHQQFRLADYLRLPASDTKASGKIAEVDVEGMDFHDGYLWVVGSHSLKRGQPKDGDTAADAGKRLAKISADGNRYLLARIPVVEIEGSFVLAREADDGGVTRSAAQLNGDALGNELTRALADDDHLGPFLAIPGKDNGFDIEGLAVVDGRVFLGLRGPVVRGWAVVLELQLKEAAPSSLTLKAIGPKRQPYLKHFLQLGGLGIRDICVDGADLLVLAGPTMDLDGPVSVFRWPGGAAPDSEGVVGAGQLQHVLDVPFGHGTDHAEGMTWLSPPGGGDPALLVVYDSASDKRQVGPHSVCADIFEIPL